MQTKAKTINNSIVHDMGLNIRNSDDVVLKNIIALLHHRFSGKENDFIFGFNVEQRKLAKQLIGEYYSYSPTCDDLYNIFKNIIINESEFINEDLMNFNGVIKHGKQLNKNK